ncbi:NfeD family protein [Belnapia sp. T6]|uniref:NfeD family protein n=1 Tax=Belnapia mucosa TaxID=2804532 RepID=A0ABS1UWW7_9PROT|nr:NfeD family protein [Belnapia mucosa]MBL6453960.1 NfeD family protein [Belnapia mucosa]
MEPGLIWVLAGLLLLLAELALPGIFLLWIGIAAIGTGLLLLLSTPSFEMASMVFLALLGGGIWLALRLRRPAPASRLNTPGSGLVGRSGLLLPLGEAAGPGLRVRIGDSEWQARLPRDIKVPDVALKVRVEGVDGTTLIVRPE